VQLSGETSESMQWVMKSNYETDIRRNGLLQSCLSKFNGESFAVLLV